MTNNTYLESIFFNVLDDLKDFQNDLTLVGGWLPYIYTHFLWKNFPPEPVTTTDIDFGFGIYFDSTRLRTIFESLSSLDYKERHIEFGKIYPVVLYKNGKIRLDFIASLDVQDEIIDKLVGKTNMDK